VQTKDLAGLAPSASLRAGRPGKGASRVKRKRRSLWLRLNGKSLIFCSKFYYSGLRKVICKAKLLKISVVYDFQLDKKWGEECGAGFRAIVSAG
jgi:hypothetical protein